MITCKLADINVVVVKLFATVNLTQVILCLPDDSEVDKPRHHSFDETSGLICHVCHLAVVSSLLSYKEIPLEMEVARLT